MGIVETISILIAVLMASLVGSTHCVGMCGPFAVLVANPTDPQKSSIFWTTMFYHMGRLLTYGLIGLVAGLTGRLFDFGGQILGWQQTAVWIAGVAMISYGLITLLSLIRLGNVHFRVPARYTSWLQSGYRWSNRQQGPLRPFAIGATTAGLPCGWLYAFVILAIGTSYPLQGMLIMLAFWLGTIPALSVLSIGLDRLPGTWKRMLPYLAASLLIVSGMLTVSVRAYADFSTLQSSCPQPHENFSVRQLVDQPKPCCH